MEQENLQSLVLKGLEQNAPIELHPLQGFLLTHLLLLEFLWWSLWIVVLLVVAVRGIMKLSNHRST